MTIKEKLDSLSWEEKSQYVFNYGLLLAEKDFGESLKGLLFIINYGSSEHLAVEIQILGNLIVSIIDGPIGDNSFVSKYNDELQRLLDNF